ncbi:NUDIX hydrolase [Dactylosporangium salmoneum]
MSSVVKRAARAILIDDEQRLLLIKRTKRDQPPYWTAPGGGVEPSDVSVEQAMRRELREEIGAEVGAVQQVFLVSTPAGEAGFGVQHFFVCRLERLELDNRSGPEFADPSRGGYDLDRIAIGADGSIQVDLKPESLKAFIQTNWAALTDATAGLTEQTSQQLG